MGWGNGLCQKRLLASLKGLGSCREGGIVGGGRVVLLVRQIFMDHLSQGSGEGGGGEGMGNRWGLSPLTTILGLSLPEPSKFEETKRDASDMTNALPWEASSTMGGGTCMTGAVFLRAGRRREKKRSHRHPGRQHVIIEGGSKVR